MPIHGLNAPTRTSFSWSHVLAVTVRFVPEPAVRPVVESWMITGTPSDVQHTSHSTPSTPRSNARRNAAIVFSGRSFDSPRCDMMRGIAMSANNGDAAPQSTAIATNDADFNDLNDIENSLLLIHPS